MRECVWHAIVCNWCFEELKLSDIRDPRPELALATRTSKNTAARTMRPPSALELRRLVSSGGHPQQRPYCSHKSSLLNGRRRTLPSRRNVRLHSLAAVAGLLILVSQAFGVPHQRAPSVIGRTRTQHSPYALPTAATLETNTDTGVIHFYPPPAGPSKHTHCCLNNKMLGILIKLQRLCAACRAGSSDVALIPVEIEEHGFYGMYNSSAIEALKAEGLANKCPFVTSEEAKALPWQQHMIKLKGRGRGVKDAILGGQFHCWLYTNLQVPPHIKPGFTGCVTEIANAFGRSFAPGVIEQDPLSTLRSLDYTTVHVRIERDWMARCRGEAARGNAVKWCFTTNEIAQAVREDNELASHKNFALIHGRQLAAEDQGSGHPAEVWKRVLPDSQIFDRTLSKCYFKGTQTSTGLDGMIMDLLIAEAGRRFLGHFGSTFTTGALQGHSCKRGPQESNAVEAALDMAVYSCPPQQDISRWKLRSIGNCQGVKGIGWGGWGK